VQLGFGEDGAFQIPGFAGIVTLMTLMKVRVSGARRRRRGRMPTVGFPDQVLQMRHDLVGPLEFAADHQASGRRSSA